MAIQVLGCGKRSPLSQNLLKIKEEKKDIT